MTRRGCRIPRGVVAVAAALLAVAVTATGPASLARPTAHPAAHPTADSSAERPARTTYPKWTAHRKIDAYGGIYSVSCPSAQRCVALGNTSLSFKVATLMWDGLRWTHGKKLPLYAPARVSCPTTTFCVAVGKATDGTARGAVVRWNGTKWSAATSITSTNGNDLRTVGCSSATFCVVGDSVGDVQTWNGHTWSAPVTVEPTPTPLTAIECVSRSFCVAGDGQGRVFTLRKSGWSQAPAVQNAKSIWSISCTSPSFCMSVGSDFQGYASRWNGSGWSAMKLIDNNPSLSVTCPRKSYCVAVTDHGWDTVWNGKRWGSVHRISDLLYLGAVSCPTRRFCMTTAADSTGLAYWTPLPRPRIVLTDNAPRIRHGDTLVFTVRLTGRGRTPTGTITWALKGPGSPSCAPSRLKAGQATCRIAHARAGRYTAKATYSGDPWYRPVSAVDHATVQ